MVLDGILAEETSSVIEQLNEIMKNRTANDESDWNSTGFVMSPTEPDSVQKIQSLGLYYPGVCDLVFKNEKIQSVLRTLTDIGEQDFFGTKFFPMRPGGTSVNWHQDNHFFGTASPQITSCAVYLEATDRENGSLKVIPKSHLDGEVKHGPGEGIWANGEWALDVDESKAIDIKCSPGTVVLFNALLLHAAHVNTSKNRTRYSIFAHFVPHDLDFKWRDVDFSYGVYRDRYRAAKLANN